MASLAATVDRVAAYTAPSLVSASSIAAIDELCGSFPAALSSCVFLERWLTEDHCDVDLILRVLPASGSILASTHPLLTIAEGLREQPGWEPLGCFAREWLRAGTPLEQGIEALWLEFDRTSGATLSRTPRVFIDFRRETYMRADRGAQLALALATIRALGGEPSRPLADCLRECLSRLPPGACVPYIGLALDSVVRRVRLCVLGAATADLASYLASVGWPGDGEDLSSEILAELGGALGDTQKSVSILHMDVGYGVEPRIGIEYGLERASQMRGRVRERALLDLLVARGWCATATREALLEWPGFSVELMDHEIWYSRFVRRLNHIKLTYATGEPVHVKVYLCCFHALLRAAALAANLLGYPRSFPRELLTSDILGRTAAPRR